MAAIPKDVQEFAQGKTGWVASVSKNGVPNVTPKGSVKIIDDEHILFADLFSLKTRANLEENPYAAVTVSDAEAGKAYQFKGKVKMLDSGEVFESLKDELKKAPIDLPELKYAVLISVESIYDQSAGPNAGREL